MLASRCYSIWDGQAPDLAIVFISAHHASSYYSAPELIIEKLSPGALIGCSAAGVIGAGHEVERRSAVAVCAATMPGVNVHTFAVENFDLPDMDAPPETWEELIGAPAAECPAIILLPDPFSIPAGDLLSGLDYAYPSSRQGRRPSQRRRRARQQRLILRQAGPKIGTRGRCVHRGPGG